MPPVKTKRAYQRKKSRVSDMSLDEIQDKLRKRGIKPPSTFTREQLLELLDENNDEHLTNKNLDAQSITDLVNSVKALQKTVETQGETIQSLVRENSNSAVSSTMPTANTVTIDSVSEPVVNAPSVTSAYPVQTNSGTNFAVNPFTRISAGMFPHIQVVTPAIRKQIT